MLQQANVSLPKGIELRVHGKKFNGMPLGKLHLLAAACTPMAAVQVLTGCNLRWWSFLQPLNAFILSGTCGGADGVCAGPGPL